MRSTHRKPEEMWYVCLERSKGKVECDADVPLDVVHKAVYICSSYLLTDDELSGSSLIEELCSTLQRLFFYLYSDDTATESECPD